jgi:hypothetical protein
MWVINGPKWVMRNEVGPRMKADVPFGSRRVGSSRASSMSESTLVVDERRDMTDGCAFWVVDLGLTTPFDPSQGAAYKRSNLFPLDVSTFAWLAPRRPPLGSWNA